MYIQLNSQVICYEKTGEGSPVILIHGNKEDHHIFDELVKTMSKEHLVIAMDSRGHGESAKPNEYHYIDMAADVVNLIRALELDKPAIVGFSDGGIVALLVAIKHGSSIGRIVCCGANLSPDGFKHGALRDLKKEYKQTSDPLVGLMLTEPNIDDYMLCNVKVPALIIAGENDLIKEKETMHIAKKIKGASVKILPKEDHGGYIYNTDKLYPHIRDFLI